ncbi:hypothetical protein [Myxosarcina sp. GI1(2024)]
MTAMWLDKSEMPYLWEVIWSELASREGDRVCENQGEIWQYMGSKLENDRVIHTFRHRYHPKTLNRQYLHITTDFTGVVIKQ